MSVASLKKRFLLYMCPEKAEFENDLHSCSEEKKNEQEINMNRYNKMAKIKRLRCNLMKLTPQGMMNDKANVFKDENQLSHTPQKCL